MLHYTDDAGYKAISTQAVWTFKVFKPPGIHPPGAYFTTLPPKTSNLAVRLRIPKLKLAFVFDFNGEQGLKPLNGGRGEYIFWSPTDYTVEEDRQVYNGPTEKMP